MTKREQIEKLLEDYIDVPNYSYFKNYKLNLSNEDCYNALIDELLKIK